MSCAVFLQTCPLTRVISWQGIYQTFLRHVKFFHRETSTCPKFLIGSINIALSVSYTKSFGWNGYWHHFLFLWKRPFRCILTICKWMALLYVCYYLLIRQRQILFNSRVFLQELQNRLPFRHAWNCSFYAYTKWCCCSCSHKSYKWQQSEIPMTFLQYLKTKNILRKRTPISCIEGIKHDQSQLG